MIVNMMWGVIDTDCVDNGDFHESAMSHIIGYGQAVRASVFSKDY